MLYIFIWLWVLVFAVFVSMLFRIVVPTNEVHIVQSSKSTQPFGKWFDKGAVYFNWPSWMPYIGITRIVLPMSIFTVSLDAYSAYDIGKVPFEVDVMAWFRVDNAPTAAQRIENFDELKDQLDDILRWAVRKVLASSDVETIMETRKEMSKQFVSEVLEQANEYGVTTISIEFMDIRDPNDHSSKTITDIMNKKKSLIEKESRIEVAENTKLAEIKEISAHKEAEVEKQAALEAVGKREAERNESVGVAKQLAEQKILLEAKTTEINKMEVLEVETVRKAEIAKSAEIVKSEEVAKKLEVEAAGQQVQIETIATWQMNAELQRAKGIEAVGKAEAEAKKAMELAPVSAQIELAKEIGENKWYQYYLLAVEGIKASENVGVAKAKALEVADMKIVATSGNVESGLDNLLDVLSAKGGIAISNGLEVLNQFPAGKELLKKIIGNNEAEVIEDDTPKLSENS